MWNQKCRWQASHLALRPEELVKQRLIGTHIPLRRNHDSLPKRILFLSLETPDEALLLSGILSANIPTHLNDLRGAPFLKLSLRLF